jgi:hypothetical protein
VEKSEALTVISVTWYLLYDGTSEDGRGTPSYVGRTVQHADAVRFITNRKSPYWAGHVLVVGDTWEKKTTRLGDL